MALYAANAPEEKAQASDFMRLVSDIVRQQALSGIECRRYDGEYGKAMRSSMDLARGGPMSTSPRRLRTAPRASREGRAAWTYGSKERTTSPTSLCCRGKCRRERARGRAAPASSATLYGLTCTAPVKYVATRPSKRDIENLAAAVRATAVEDAFMTAVSPATLQILPNALLQERRALHLRRWPRPSARNTRLSSTPVYPADRRSRHWWTSTTGGFR